jgi:FAD/FMN-containing dehydrogenase
MKKAYLKELANGLLGTVTDDPATLERFATDASIFEVPPAAVAYPANTTDVRHLVEFARNRTATGKPLSLTARGLGSSRTGAALGEGVEVVFPAYMDKLLRLESTAVAVQPGLSSHTLQQILLSHGRWLPPLHGIGHHTTLGGAVSIGSAGPKSIKYGPLRHYVKSLKVVLADGSIITTHRLTARELGRKRGLSTFEGEIYRKLTNLLSDHAMLIAEHEPTAARNTAGYALSAVRTSGGAFDLSQIFIGAEGTLGLITEITLATAPFHPRTTLVVGGCDSLDHAAQALVKLRELGPSALEFVDRAWLETLREHHPSYLAGLLSEHTPRLFFFAEFDDVSQLAQKFKSVRAARVLARGGGRPHTTADPLEQLTWWKIRHAIGETVWPGLSAKAALPIADDAVVPPAHWSQALDKTAKLLAKYDLAAPLSGHAGDGHLALRPPLELARKKDVDKLFNLSREFTDLIVALGGTPSGQAGDGLLRGPLLSRVYGDELAAVHAEVKNTFDPHGLFSPLTKTAATESYARAHLRTDYSATRFADYPPSS